MECFLGEVTSQLPIHPLCATFSEQCAGQLKSGAELVVVMQIYISSRRNSSHKYGRPLVSNMTTD